MRDFHTHILPGIDDGSRDIDMTARMLAMEADQGVTHIYATPHFYAHRHTIPQFLERRAASFAQVQELARAGRSAAARDASQRAFPEVTVGAEVYYFTGIGRAAQLNELCIEGTDLLLLEMPFDQWTRDVYRDVTDVLHRQRLRVVLAHVERYYDLQRDKTVWDEVMALPVTVQLNAGGILDDGHGLFHRGGTRKLCLRLLEEHDNVILGSDCHNLTDRAPNLAAARAVIEHKAGAERLAALDAYADALLGH